MCTDKCYLIKFVLLFHRPSSMRLSIEHSCRSYGFNFFETCLHISIHKTGIILMHLVIKIAIDYLDYIL